MPGVGTKRDITIASGRTRCLDLTRLISRAGRRLTGIDRVELAYLRKLVAIDEPLFGLIRTSLGYILLDRSGLEALVQRLSTQDWQPPDLLSRMTHRGAPLRQGAETEVRRHAIARCRPRGLARMVAKHIPQGATYFNVGQSNLSRRVFDAFAHTQRTIMIHDTIPLDFPQYQADGMSERFAGVLRRAGQFADLLVYNSAQTQRDATRYFEQWGLAPAGIVAHLGILEPDLTGGVWPKRVDPTRPVFVVAGTIEPRKNHALALDVWEQLASERGEADMPQLVIAGARGWKNNAVFQRLDRAAPWVIELNTLSDEDLFILMQGAMGVLMPSVAEGFGLVPAEAIKLGTPVICGDLPIYREFLGEIPVYLNVNDAYLWKGAVEELLVGQEKQSRKQANSTSITLPTWEDHFNTVLRVA